MLTAVLALVGEGTLDELSIPAVADRSGVSIATIYRHFPTRDDLLAAAAAEPSRQALARDPDSRPDGADLPAVQRAMWHGFAKNLPLLRHQMASAAGREMRAARLESSRRALATYLESQGVDPTTPAGERLISLLLLLNGSLALIELHDRQGLDVDESIDRSLWATRVLVDATRKSHDP